MLRTVETIAGCPHPNRSGDQETKQNKTQRKAFFLSSYFVNKIRDDDKRQHVHKMMINMLFHFLFYILYLALKVTAIIDNKVKLKFQLNRNLKYTFLNNYKKGQKNTKTDRLWR